VNLLSDLLMHKVDNCLTLKAVTTKNNKWFSFTS